MTQIKHQTPTEKDGLIFIPDISGFTKFVHDTDIKLGKEIAAELLSVMLHANILHLQVSEIEGDAILFYRYGTPPTLRELMNQYELMLVAFKKKLVALKTKLHLPVLELSIKLIVHFGPIAEYKLCGFRKLYGETVVTAHHLLKNNIPSHNYILITKGFFNKAVNDEADTIILPQWIKKQNFDIAANSYLGAPFMYFLYDTEVLKLRVLNGDENNFITNTYDPH